MALSGRDRSEALAKHRFFGDAGAWGGRVVIRTFLQYPRSAIGTMSTEDTIKTQGIRPHVRPSSDSAACSLRGARLGRGSGGLGRLGVARRHPS